MDYHERLDIQSRKQKRDSTLSMHDKRLRAKKGNLLGHVTNKTERGRCIDAVTIPTALSKKFKTKIQHFMARQMERLFNAILYTLQCKSGISADTSKWHLDKWLITNPNTPKIDKYGAFVPTESNSICKHSAQVADPNCG